jgi:hypothetical protein
MPLAELPSMTIASAHSYLSTQSKGTRYRWCPVGRHLAQLRIVTAVSFDPDLTAATQDCLRARFVGNHRHRIQFAKFADEILTKLLRTCLGSERLNVKPSDLISGRRLPGKRESYHRPAERKTGGQPEPGKAHGRDYPPTPWQPMRFTCGRKSQRRKRFAIVLRRSFAQERGRRPALSADSVQFQCVRNARSKGPPYRFPR